MLSNLWITETNPGSDAKLGNASLQRVASIRPRICFIFISGNNNAILYTYRWVMQYLQSKIMFHNKRIPSWRDSFIM